MRMKRKKRLDWRPALNKLFDPIFDPVPKGSKERWGADASEIYYGSERSGFREWKNRQYRKYVLYNILPLFLLLLALVLFVLSKAV